MFIMSLLSQGCFSRSVKSPWLVKPPFEWRTEDGKVKINNGFITVANEMEVTGTGEGTLGLHGHVEDRSGCQVPSLVPPHSIYCVREREQWRVFQRCGWQVFLGGHLSEDLQGEMGHVDDGGREGQACLTKVLASHR